MKPEKSSYYDGSTKKPVFSGKTKYFEWVIKPDTVKSSAPFPYYPYYKN
ncbi:hypothetical protein [Bacillus sp. AK031]